MHLKNLVRIIPLNRLMIETDAPFLTPRYLKEKPKVGRNELFATCFQTVERCMAKLVEEVVKATTETATKFFGI